MVKPYRTPKGKQPSDARMLCFAMGFLFDNLGDTEVAEMLYGRKVTDEEVNALVKHYQDQPWLTVQVALLDYDNGATSRVALTCKQLDSEVYGYVEDNWEEMGTPGRLPKTHQLAIERYFEHNAENDEGMTGDFAYLRFDLEVFDDKETKKNKS